MAYRIAPFLMTLSNLQGHLSIARFFKCDFSNSTISDDLEWPWRSFVHCKPSRRRLFLQYRFGAVNKISTDIARRAVPLL